jgi:hypothetical protein
MGEIFAVKESDKPLIFLYLGTKPLFAVGTQNDTISSP